MKAIMPTSILSHLGLAFFAASAIGQEPFKPSLTHGALAVAPGRGRDFHGFGTGSSPQAAQRAAMADCSDSSCKVVIVYGPGQCSHVALGKRQLFWNNKGFSKGEKDFTLDVCRKNDTDCKIIRSECFPEPLHPQPALSDTPEAFGQVLGAWAAKNAINKAIVVVRRGGQIVYRSSFGDADPDAPYHLFSLSKAITGACVATLIRDGKLTFNTSLATALAKYFEANGKPADPRIETITIEQLLTHRAGISGTVDKNDAGSGTNLKAYLAVHSAGLPPPPSLLAGAFTMNLIRDPGAAYAYSNASYLALGFVIEEITGKPYEAYCRDAVLNPINVHADLEPAWRVMWSYGGWRMTGADYLAFLDYFDARDQRLGSQAKTWMHTPAGKVTSADGSIWYGLGMGVRRSDEGVNVWHWGSWRYDMLESKDGPLRSSGITFAMRWHDGTGWFVAASPYMPDGELRRELGRNLEDAYQAVKRWN